MALTIECGGCGARYQAKPELAGTLVDCPKCHTRIMVPRKAAVGAQSSSDSVAPARSPAARSPAARPAASAPKSVRPAAAATPAPRVPDDDEDVIKLLDDDDEPAPASRSQKPNQSENDPFELAPEPELPQRSRAGRGSVAGGSVAGGSVAGGSLAGGSLAGGSTAGGSMAGRSKAGSSRAGGSVAGRSGSTSGMDLGGKRESQSSARNERSRSAPPLDDSADNDDFSNVLDIVESEPKADEGDSFNFTIPVLPAVVTRTIMPWAIVVVCLGGAAYDAVTSVLALPGNAVGLSLIAAALLLYAVVVVRLTLKAIYSASVSAKLRLPDVAYFQTFALLALPTAGLVLGYYAGGIGPMITLGLLGLVVMVVPMAFMFRADVTQTLTAAFYAGLAFVPSTALCAGILIGAGMLIGNTKWTLPWKHEPVADAAKVDQAPAVVVVPDAPVAAPVVAAPKPVAAPLVAAAPAPVVPTGPAWRVPVEPLPENAAWPVPQKEIHESIEVMTPVATAHAIGGGPFVALLQPKTTAIYDLRNGKRAGFIKAGFDARNLILSPDGAMLAGTETAESQGNGLFAANAGAVAGAMEIWSVADIRLVGQVPSGQTAVDPQPLGFAGGKLIAFGSSNGMSGLQSWDPASGLLLHQWSTPPLSRASVAISNFGKFVAVTANPVIRLFDLQSGDIAGELSSPVGLAQIKGVAFSPDGKMIAAIVPSMDASSAATANLLEWSIGDGGKLLRTVPIDLTAAAAPFNPVMAGSAIDTTDIPYLQWTPQARTVRVGAGLFEVTSGKAVYSIPAQTSGNLTGRLISVADKRTAYEFLPTGSGSHVVLKTVDLPNAMIDSAVTAAIGSAGKLDVSSGASATGPAPSSSPAAGAVLAGALPSAAVATSTDAMMVASGVAPPSAPSQIAPAPLPTVDLAMRGQWDVHVKSTLAADPGLIQKQLAAEAAAIAKTQSDLDTAILRYDQVSRYQEGTDGNGEITRQYQFSDELRTNSHLLVTTLQDRLREEKAIVIKITRAAAAAPTSRMMLGTLDNGISVEVTTDSDAGAALVDGMHIGDRVHVVGFGQINDGTLLIKLRSASATTNPVQ